MTKPKSTVPDHYLAAELYQLVRETPEIFEFLQSGSLDGLWYWDLDNPEHEWMNDAFWETLGYDPRERKHLAAEWQDIIHPDDLAEALDNFQKHCADPTYPYDQIVRYTAKDGGMVWVRCRGIAIRDEHGRPIRMLGAHNDLTALKRVEAELRSANEALSTLARNDPLTGISNRRVFDEQLPLHASISARSGRSLSLLHIDLDHFKVLNDRHGHLAGDAVLRSVAAALQSHLREGDICCRIGGEEFAVIAHNISLADTEQLCERLRAEIEHRTRDTVRTTASIGACVLPALLLENEARPSGKQLADALYGRADELMYQVKRAGRNHHRVDELALHAKVIQRRDS